MPNGKSPGGADARPARPLPALSRLLQRTIEDIATTTDLIAVRLTDTGTPEKEWLEVEPSKRFMRIAEFAFYRMRDGKVAEMWFLLDTPAAKAQLDPDSQHE